jgi:hypothetical protein
MSENTSKEPSQSERSETGPALRRKAPSIQQLERWMSDSIAEAVDGCQVEPDGTCEHGSPSWLLRMGLI